MEIEKEQILQELKAIGFARPTDFFAQKEGIWTLADPLPPEAGAAISALETTGKGIKIRFYDKLRVLELLGRQVGLFRQEQPQVQDDGGLLDAILRATTEEVDTDDLPELQQAAAAGDELVEQTEAEPF